MVPKRRVCACAPPPPPPPPPAEVPSYATHSTAVVEEVGDDSELGLSGQGSERAAASSDLSGHGVDEAVAGSDPEPGWQIVAPIGSRPGSEEPDQQPGASSGAAPPRRNRWNRRYRSAF